ncbi:MAG: hypothetical protein HY901_33330 [Deltaproteobacteria bacterium]|nr:hypothetical protein [Deltaproteobacteria bacterium]
MLTAVSDQGNREELTRFTTSETTDASPGTPATIKSLSVKVMEYPPEEVQGSMCVGCSTASLAFVEFNPAHLPDTFAGSVLYSWTVYPESGFGDSLSGPIRYAAGAESFGCRGPFPCGPAACANLQVGSRYCAKVMAWGIPYAPDKALVSDEVCTRVVREVRPGRGGADAGVEGDDARGPGPDVEIPAGQADAGGPALGSSGCAIAAGDCLALLPLLVLLGMGRRIR